MREARIVVLLLSLLCTIMAAESPKVDVKRIEQRILALSQFGKNPEGGVSRVAFSDADIAGRKYIMTLMEQAGLKVRVDEAGNLLGRREGSNASLPVIMTGSHIDSVPKGGNYDGDVGVIGAIECAEILKENRILTEHPLEFVVFSDEEGGLVGSRAMAGELTVDALDIVSHSGKTIRDGIRAIGGDPDRVSKIERKKTEIHAFLELHIEQGAVLDSEKIQIGIVEGIVGINWWDVTIEGFSNHAGTTPMDRRKDALIAAARLILAINEAAISIPGRQVATVGRIKAEPGAPNVIPGKVVLSLEIRDLSSSKIQEVYEKIRGKAEIIAEETGTTFRFSPIDATAVPALTDPRIQKIIMESATELGLSHKFLPSGAGHDAQDMARITPTGMIFVPSVGGISHSPKEFTPPEDIGNGVQVLLRTILKIDQQEL